MTVISIVFTAMNISIIKDNIWQIFFMLKELLNGKIWLVTLTLIIPIPIITFQKKSGNSVNDSKYDSLETEFIQTSQATT